MNTPPRYTGPARLTHRASFSVLIAANILLMATTSAPSPIYPIYLQRWGFSMTILTIVFAVYVAGLATALLTVGSLSDHLGRRPVLITSLLVAATATAIFWTANGVLSLLIARLVQGLATGTATGALAGLALLRRDRQPSIPFDYNNIRDRMTAPRWRPRLKVTDGGIVIAAATGLTAVSVALAAPASATHHHGIDGPGKHTATSASQDRSEGAGDSTRRLRPDGVDNFGKVTTDPFPVGESATAAEAGNADPETSA